MRHDPTTTTTLKIKQLEIIEGIPPLGYHFRILEKPDLRLPVFDERITEYTGGACNCDGVYSHARSLGRNPVFARNEYIKKLRGWRSSAIMGLSRLLADWSSRLDRGSATAANPARSTHSEIEGDGGRWMELDLDAIENVIVPNLPTNLDPVHSITDKALSQIPALIAEVRRLRAENKELHIRMHDDVPRFVLRPIS